MTPNLQNRHHLPPNGGTNGLAPAMLGTGVAVSRDGESRGASGTPPGGGTSLSSMEVLRRARDGDRTALESLCRRHLPRLQRWATGRLPAWARGNVDTDDLVQETLLRSVERLPHFEPRHEGAFHGYLRQALRNRIRDEVRRAGRTLPLDEQRTAADDAGLSPLERAIGHEQMERYERALERLGPESRQAVILRIELDMPYAEIAEALAKPSPDAARMAVSRALVKLAAEMDR